MGALYLASETIAGQIRQVVVKEMLNYYDAADTQGPDKAARRFETEAATLATLSLAGVPQIFDYFSESGHNYIVMQFIEGKNLEARLTHLDENGDQVRGRPYPVDQVRSWGVKLCKILDMLSAKGIIHMDIKPANLILDGMGEIWLVDFGTVKAHLFASPGAKLGAQKTSIYGTMGYAPPEQVAGKPEARSDVYALAATLYHLLTDDDPRIPTKPFQKLNQLPAELARALRQALDDDVSKRMEAAKFGELLDTRPSSSLPFRWRDRTFSYDPRDLAIPANQKWKEALGYYVGGDWENWLRTIHHHDLMNNLQEIKAAEPIPEIGMDRFLRLVDPTFPTPRLSLSASTFNMGTLPWRSTRELSLLLRNTGGGCLYGQISSLSTGISVDPVDFACRHEQVCKVTVNAAPLTPLASPQRLALMIDAGAAGQEKFTVFLKVPLPSLSISTALVDMGAIPKGQPGVSSLEVYNRGASPFQGEARVREPWLSVDPPQFSCAAGSSSTLVITANGDGLSFGQHETQIELFAHAGKWQERAPVQVNLGVSLLKTFWRRWGLLIRWVLAGALSGAVAGALVGAGLTFLGSEVIDSSGAIFAGLVTGAVLYGLAGLVLGGSGKVGQLPKQDGLKRGGALGLVSGMLLGGLAGMLFFALFGSLSVGWLGCWVGLMLGALLGWALYICG